MFLEREFLALIAGGGGWYPNRMRADFDLDVDVSCVSCGVAMAMPEADTERQLEVDGVIYADMIKGRCACGSRRVRVEVTVDDAAQDSTRTQTEGGDGR